MKIKSKKIPLKEVATFLNGYAFKPSDWSKEGLPIIRIQNLTGTNKEFNYYNGDYNEKYIIKDGDILISWSASLGIFLWKNITGILNQHIFKVIFDKDIEIDKLYFLHCMKYLIKKIEKNIHGSTMKHITRPEFEKINFPIYDIDLQRKIAKKLIFISEIINNNKRILVKLMDLSKSLFNSQIRPYIKELEIRKLGDIIEVKSSKRVFLNELSKNGVPFYRGTEIAKLSRNENVESNLFISEDLYQNLKKISDIPKIGDLLLPSICNNGEIWYVNKTNPFYFKDGRVLWLKLNKNINGKYLQYYLIEKFRQDYSKIASGTTFSELKIITLKNLLLPIPPIELQNKFAERIEKIEKLKFEIEKSIETAQNLYDSLIYKYFDN